MVVALRSRDGDPRSLRSDNQHGRAFFRRCKSKGHYDHSLRVTRIEMQSGIVEGPVIADPKESPERRWANSDLYNIAWYHNLDTSRLGRITAPLPPALHDPYVLEELAKFAALTTLDRAGAPTSYYESLLNGGSKPPLALLVKIVDYAVTHTTEHMLDGLIDSRHASIFRTYDSETHAYACMQNEARAGERIYAPIAELFGYPDLAGTIMNHAYRINHPDIHAQVMMAMADEVFQARLALTQRIVRQIASHIKAELKRYGFEADVTMRLQKSEGKIMRKVYRMLQTDYDCARDVEMLVQEVDNALDRLSEGKEPATSAPCTCEDDGSLERHIRSAIKGFDFQRLNDWVAARIVLLRYMGKEIRDEGSMPFRLGKSVIEHALDMQRIKRRCLEVNHEQKRGRYNADHYDVKVHVGLEPLDETPLGHEVQLKIREWHDIAEHGKAAHYYYLGGDRSFMDVIAKAYHDIIHGINGSCRKH